MQATLRVYSCVLEPFATYCAPRLRVARNLQQVARLEGVRLRGPRPLRLATLGRLRPAGAVLRPLLAAGLPPCSGFGGAGLSCVARRRPQLLPCERLPVVARWKCEVTLIVKWDSNAWVAAEVTLQTCGVLGLWCSQAESVAPCVARQREAACEARSGTGLATTRAEGA